MLTGVRRASVGICVNVCVSWWCWGWLVGLQGGRTSTVCGRVSLGHRRIGKGGRAPSHRKCMVGRVCAGRLTWKALVASRQPPRMAPLRAVATMVSPLSRDLWVGVVLGVGSGSVSSFVVVCARSMCWRTQQEGNLERAADRSSQSPGVDPRPGLRTVSDGSIQGPWAGTGTARARAAPNCPSRRQRALAVTDRGRCVDSLESRAGRSIRSEPSLVLLEPRMSINEASSLVAAESNRGIDSFETQGVSSCPTSTRVVGP